MGFCRSGESGTRPCWGGHYVPRCAGWVGPTVLLCIYGFCSMMRPIEPFLTEFLTATKNLTTEQVTSQLYPVWTYSTLLLLIPVLLVTDFLTYKPVIILQGATYVTTILLLIFGSGVHLAQLAFFCYSIAMAADVAYFSYIYTMVQPSYYQRVTSYVKGSILLGYAVGALLAQLLVSLGGVSLNCLAFLTLISVSMAFVTSFFLPMPQTSSFPKGTCVAQQKHSGGDSQDAESQDFFIWVKCVTAAKHVGRMSKSLLLDCKKCYSSVAVVFFCIWEASGSCGFYQVTSYIQLLWLHLQPHNFTAYNGVVDGISTLTGAAATVAVGHMPLEWSVWGELVLGAFTFLMAGSVFLMNLTDNIWMSYIFSTLFKTFFMQLGTICTFQIAKTLSRKRYALVFGMNRFVGSVLQSIITAIVINALRVTITVQFVIYASYFSAIALLFTVRGVYTALQKKRFNQPERATNLPEI